MIADGPGPLIEDEYEKEQTNKELKKQLCPYAAVGECRYGLNCAYLHGDVCDMCGLQVLHPSDTAQRSQHIKVSVFFILDEIFLLVFSTILFIPSVVYIGLHVPCFL